MIEITVCAKDPATEKRWLQELTVAKNALPDVRFSAYGDGSIVGQIMLMDQRHPRIDSILSRTERKQRAIFLVLEDQSDVPDLLRDGCVDDVLLYPFRQLDLLSKFQHYRQILMWDEVSQLNASFSGVIEQFRDDIKLAERIQRSRAESRFNDVKGYRVRNRYLAGMRSGGDYFDVAEPKQGGTVSLVLSDSSSYGLSSAMLSILMKVAAKLTPESTGSASKTVESIQSELKLILGEKDRLSLFYGVISRKEQSLRYLNLGGTAVFYAAPGEAFEYFPSQGSPIDRNAYSTSFVEQTIRLEPEGRLVLLSDGILELVGGVNAIHAILNQFREQDALALENELIYRIKSKLNPEEGEMPAQDCTLVSVDVESKVVQLASKKQ